ATGLSESTRGLIGAKQLAAMKKTAWLVNAAHTALVDLPALAQALKKKQLAGAGVDTTGIGALGEEDAVRKAGAVLTSHSGARSAEARERSWRLVRENVRRFAAGEPLLCVVERSSGGSGGGGGRRK